MQGHYIIRCIDWGGDAEEPFRATLRRNSNKLLDYFDAIAAQCNSLSEQSFLFILILMNDIGKYLSKLGKTNNR